LHLTMLSRLSSIQQCCVYLAEMTRLNVLLHNGWHFVV
jgi:hypothetical protein